MWHVIVTPGTARQGRKGGRRVGEGGGRRNRVEKGTPKQMTVWQKRTGEVLKNLQNRYSGNAALSHVKI